MERPFYVSSTGGTFEPYIPPEGDGKKSAISAGGAKQKVEQLEKKTKSMMAIRKIRSYEEDFDAGDFAQRAQDYYIQAHQTLSEKNKYKLRELVTELAYPQMMNNVRDKTIHWRFLQSLEPPRVVHARCTDVITKENIFGQVTVRFHTQQILAIYDRFGRLMHGSEILAKDVLEYVVFEKHLSNEYGVWRLHDKVIPQWTEEKQPAYITYRVDDEPEKTTAVEAVAPAAEEEKKETASVSN
jgi:large subunit ribosomal protein L45